jgi:Calcineurin-like phosphoesterase
MRAIRGMHIGDVETYVHSRGVKDNPARSLVKLAEYANRDQIENPETYKAALFAVLKVLNNEDGLIHLLNAPTLIIPDLHARRGMLVDILSNPIKEGPYEGRKVFELLQKGLVNVCCVGDIMHSEERTNWVINDNGDWTHELLEKEMVRSLGSAAMIMYLKMQYPEHFHCLRGNHDDIVGELAKDFRKFVGLQFKNDKCVIVDGSPVVTSDKGESTIVRDWILTRGDGWGQTFLDLWGQFDKTLPIFAKGEFYAISHTLPQRALEEAEIRDKTRLPSVTLELTSRRGENRQAIIATLENLGIKDSVKRWFYGHTHVSAETNCGKYEESADGLLVRLNNHKNYVYAYVPASLDQRLFDPAKDVYIKSPSETSFHI